MRWLNSITNSMGTNLSKFQETVGFTDSSVGKESACNTGDSSSIPWSGRSPGEGIGYLLQYSYLENFMDRGAWQATVHGVTKSQTRLSTQHTGLLHLYSEYTHIHECVHVYGGGWACISNIKGTHIYIHVDSYDTSLMII